MLFMLVFGSKKTDFNLSLLCHIVAIIVPGTIAVRYLIRNSTNIFSYPGLIEKDISCVLNKIWI